MKKIDGWLNGAKKQMDGWKEGYNIDRWLDGYTLIYEIIYGLLDEYKKWMVGWIKKWMVGCIDRKNRWMVRRKDNKYENHIVGWMVG